MAPKKNAKRAIQVPAEDTRQLSPLTCNAEVKGKPGRATSKEIANVVEKAFISCFIALASLRIESVSVQLAGIA